MKTIEDRAHEILLKLVDVKELHKVKTKESACIIAENVWSIAEAMQAEVEKRKATPNADPMRKVREAEWQPDFAQVSEYCVMTDYGKGCYVYFNGELCVAHGVNNIPVALPKD